MARWPVLALALLAAPLAVPAGALHGQTCSAEGAPPALAVGVGYVIQGTLTPANAFAPNGQPHRWTLSLAEGEHYLVVGGAGDADVVVCRPGAREGQHDCTRANTSSMPETCLPLTGGGPPIVCAGAAWCDFVVYVAYGGPCCGLPVDGVTYLGGVL